MKTGDLVNIPHLNCSGEVLTDEDDSGHSEIRFTLEGKIPSTSMFHVDEVEVITHGARPVNAATTAPATTTAGEAEGTPKNKPGGGKKTPAKKKPATTETPAAE